MATPFSRTMRSVKSDGFRTALVGLALGMVVLLLWLAWFVLAQITLYETSQSATVSSAGEVVADFAPTALGRILPGQSALVRLGNNAATGLPQAVPAVVMNVEDETSRGRVRAELYMLDLPADLAVGQTGTIGQVEVEVEYVSPAVLVMRASGQFLHTPGVAVSPQENQNVPGYP